MKNRYKSLSTTLFVLIAFLAGSSLLTAQTVQVTFRVDMSEVGIISPNGVHIAGSFQGWNPGSTLMIQPPFGKIYTYKQDFTPGTQIQFKYVNGNAWGTDESVPAGCALGGNRFLTVPDQDIVLSVVCYGSCTVCNPAQVDITFQVDMSNQTVSPNGVHVAGSFQSWNPATTEMLPVGNGVYAVSLTLGEGEYFEYKFINGNAWGTDETVPPACASNGNRYISVPGVSTTLDPVCFGSCNPCGGVPVDVDITFTVDMSEQEISPAGVHIAGGFQGWDPGATLMTDEGEGIYSFTAVFSSGTYQEYKFVNGTTWPESENLPGECSNNNNRYFEVPVVSTTLETVCYGLCGPCPQPAEVDVTFQVDMSEQTVSGNGVHLIGSFNEYDPTANPMNLQRNGIYETTLTLTQDEYHTYKFVNGNSLAGQETVPGACSSLDGYRELTVPGEALVIDDVCFGACEPCIPPPTVNVTFRVDMSNETVSTQGVHLAGSFQGWNPATSPMTEMGDGIFELTLVLESGVHYNYKYINGITFVEQEDVPAECGEDNGVGSYDRYIDVPETDLILDLVCYSSCSECVAIVYSDVTFLVDMSKETVSGDGVHVAGNFNGFNSEATAMTDIGDNIFSATVPIVVGDHIVYKFLNGNSYDFAEAVPAECGEDDGFNGYNRFFDGPEIATTLDLVCFSSCVACPPPAEVQITFQVDMSNETVSEDGVYLAGTFNDFVPSSTPMANQGEGVWVATLTLTEGTQIMYKFVNGLDISGSETVPAECSQEDGNRAFSVPAENTILDVVCFGACGPCIPPPSVNVTFRVDMSNETVSPEGVHLAGSFQGWDPSTSLMTDMGDGIYELTQILVSGMHHTYKYINGNSFPEQENVPAACGEDNGIGGYDRFIDVPETDVILDLVCFSSCSECVVPVYTDVTFLVDMSNETVSGDGVHVAGNFNGYDPAATALTDIGDNIFSVTVPILAGEHILYKFINGISFDYAESVPAECGEDDGFGGNNRFFDGPEIATTLGLVCFSSCSECVIPVYVDVNFSVDMSNEIVSGEGVFIAGSFNGYNASSTPMTPEGNGVYSVTLSLVAGDHHVFKYLNGPGYEFAEAVPAECGQDDGFGGYNRYLDVTETITTTVCFGSCDACQRDHVINLFAGWNSLSSNRVPDDTEIELLMSQISDELVVLQTMTEVYYPEGGINSIVNWESQSGYKIKVTEDVSITITGIVEQSKTVQLAEGWNLIPVISDSPVNVAALFDNIIGDVVVIKGVAEVGIFWPDYNINSLINLIPGKAYYVKMDAAGEINYP